MVNSTNKGSCVQLGISWLFIIIGFIAFDKFGLFYAFVPFFLAALLRGDNGKSLKKYFLNSNIIKILFFLYYMFLMVVILIYYDELFHPMLGYKFAIYLGLPYVMLAAFNDFKTCFLGK